MSMTEKQYLAVLDYARPSAPEQFEPRIHLEDRGDRTLLYGYDLDRTTVHVYMRAGEVHVVRFSPVYGDVQRRVMVKDHQRGMALDVALLIPTKRSYPERCDFEFTLWLKRQGLDPNFTTFNDAWQGSEHYAPYAGYYVGATWSDR